LEEVLVSAPLVIIIDSLANSHSCSILAFENYLKENNRVQLQSAGWELLCKERGKKTLLIKMISGMSDACKVMPVKAL